MSVRLVLVGAFLAGCLGLAEDGDSPDLPPATEPIAALVAPAATEIPATLVPAPAIEASATAIFGAGGPEFLPGSITEIQSFIDTGRPLPFAQPISRGDWGVAVEQYGGEAAPLFNLLKAQAEAQGLAVVEDAGDLNAANEVLMQVVVGEGWFIRIVGVDGMPYWTRTAVNGKQFSDHPNRISPGTTWELAKIDVQLQSGQELKPVVIGGRPYEVVVGPGGKPIAIFNPLASSETPEDALLEFWTVLPGAENLLINGRWNQVDGVKVLSGNMLEVKGYGGEDGWNSPYNKNLKLENIKGDFSIRTELAVSQGAKHGAIYLHDSTFQGNWWDSRRFEVGIGDGGRALWVGYWDGVQKEASTLLSLQGLNLAPDTDHQIEIRFNRQNNAAEIFVDASSIGVVRLDTLLDSDYLIFGYNISPDGTLRVRDLEVLVPEDGEKNVTITGLRTAGTIFVSPTPGEITVTPIVPPVEIPKPPEAVAGMTCDTSRNEYAVCWFGSGKSRNPAFESAIVNAHVTFDNPDVKDDAYGYDNISPAEMEARIAEIQITHDIIGSKWNYFRYKGKDYPSTIDGWIYIRPKP